MEFSFGGFGDPAGVLGGRAASDGPPRRAGGAAVDERADAGLRACATAAPWPTRPWTSRSCPPARSCSPSTCPGSAPPMSRSRSRRRATCSPSAASASAPPRTAGSRLPRPMAAPARSSRASSTVTVDKKPPPEPKKPRVVQVKVGEHQGK